MLDTVIGLIGFAILYVVVVEILAKSKPPTANTQQEARWRRQVAP